MRNFIFSVLLIGILFQVSHDFVFYKVDPCMKHIETAYQIDDGYCDIHENLHMPYISHIFYIPISLDFIEKYTFLYTLEYSDPFILEIFKPPKHLS
ncbi:hypothetical protein SAMN06265182_0674 [Persephonella hydrogeniphila]|uniref:Uncharacterized protein n=1 Tax=Persephonella hydrogeniphila TaxID=198703 RepID=A0A285NBZ0_9AQUI|nr:hypothetical protein [Persephonella hydrogeniphila]SNZ06433.1 hypothetical protein SAMN06265182_0674 [Persephonella hydrogeniphila]